MIGEHNCRLLGPSQLYLKLRLLQFRSVIQKFVQLRIHISKFQDCVDVSIVRNVFTQLRSSVIKQSIFIATWYSPVVGHLASCRGQCHRVKTACVKQTVVLYTMPYTANTAHTIGLSYTANTAHNIGPPYTANTAQLTQPTPPII